MSLNNSFYFFLFSKCYDNKNDKSQNRNTVCKQLKRCLTKLCSNLVSPISNGKFDHTSRIIKSKTSILPINKDFPSWPVNGIDKNICISLQMYIKRYFLIIREYI